MSDEIATDLRRLKHPVAVAAAAEIEAQRERIAELEAERDRWKAAAEAWELAHAKWDFGVRVTEPYWAEARRLIAEARGEKP